MRVHPVIMCGGSGTRLWPASRPSRPKQFLALLGERSLFQSTVLRVMGLEGADEPIIVGNVAHADQIAAQLAQIGVAATLLLEPQARDSAPAVAAAAHLIAERDPDGVAVIVASDHHIPDPSAFQAAADEAVRAAAEGAVIVTLGMRPTSPSEAYGYILPAGTMSGAAPVTAFVEKPDAETARRYIAEGYLWNSGNFIARARTLLDEIAALAPAVGEAAAAGLAQAVRSPDGRIFLSPAFADAPKISIDHAVMTHTRHAAVLPAAFTWSDLGAWDAVLETAERDPQGNRVDGAAVLVGATDNLVRAPAGLLVALVGVRNLAVIAESDALLVCDLGASQEVKTLVGRLQAEARAEVDSPPGGAGAGPAARLRHWLFASALPVWWAMGADLDRGGFHEALSPEGAPVDAERRLRVQARQTYVFAKAGLMGWPGPWRAAVRHGLEAILGRYQRPDGLFRTSVAPDGAPADDTPRLYEQAFVLLALAAAWRALPGRPDLAEAALALRSALSTFRWAGGGFKEAGEHPFQSNCHMHLFEASLAWDEAAPDAGWAGLADEIADLCLQRFIDPETGALHEFFEADWSRHPDAQAIIEPGHQFEWAWLLRQWHRARPERRLPEGLVDRLWGVGSGGVSLAGLAVNSLDGRGDVVNGASRLWPQTEWARTSLFAGDSTAQASAFAALERYLDRRSPGLWIDLIDGGRPIAGSAPGSSLYHIANVVFAAAEIS